MKATLKLRLLSLIILVAYLSRGVQWMQILNIIYDDIGLPLFLIISWRFYPAVFPWFIGACLPPNLRVAEIERLPNLSEGVARFCVRVALRGN